MGSACGHLRPFLSLATKSNGGRTSVRRLTGRVIATCSPSFCGSSSAESPRPRGGPASCAPSAARWPRPARIENGNDRRALPRRPWCTSSVLVIVVVQPMAAGGRPRRRRRQNRRGASRSRRLYKKDAMGGKFNHRYLLRCGCGFIQGGGVLLDIFFVAACLHLRRRDRARLWGSRDCSLRSVFFCPPLYSRSHIHARTPLQSATPCRRARKPVSFRMLLEAGASLENRR